MKKPMMTTRELSEAGVTRIVMPASTTWPVVQAFAARMEMKLSMNRHKGDRAGWINDDVLELFDRLKEECDELLHAMGTGSGKIEDIANEAADVANFAMMIADWYLVRSETVAEPSNVGAEARPPAQPQTEKGKYGK